MFETSLHFGWFFNLQEILGVPLLHVILEIILLGIVILIWKTKRISPRHDYLRLTKQEEEYLIRDWYPDPLVPEVSDEWQLEKINIESKLGKIVEVNGKPCLNLGTTNFLGFVGNESIEDNAIKCIEKYSVGTCGPRGFYGTTDIHLKLEKKLAEYWGTEESIIYSYGYSTVSSALCSFCKKFDIIFVDDGVSFPIQTGIIASRSKIYWFKHNDMNDLEQKLIEVEKDEIDKPKKYKNIRKFIVIEGLYANYGDFPCLPKIIEFKYKYKARLFIDESFSMGVLGENGKGLTEHYNIPITDVDMISFTFENAFGTVGGACLGSSLVIDHQRLSAVGYCFSASSPTYLCQAMIDAVSLLKSDVSLISRLKNNSSKFYTCLSSGLPSKYRIIGSMESPLLHLRFADAPKNDEEYNEQSRIFNRIVNETLSKGVLLLMSNYIREQEHNCPPPSIRTTVAVYHDEYDLSNAATTLLDILKEN